MKQKEKPQLGAGGRGVLFVILHRRFSRLFLLQLVFPSTQGHASLNDKANSTAASLGSGLRVCFYVDQPDIDKLLSFDFRVDAYQGSFRGNFSPKYESVGETARIRDARNPLPRFF
jgi:hypothetical protein